MFACSGAADAAGRRIARFWQVKEERLAKMYCLAGIGGRVESILVNAQADRRYFAGRFETITVCREQES